MHPNGCIFLWKVEKDHIQNGCLLIVCIRRAYAIRPNRIVAKYSLGGHFHAMILAHPRIPFILVQTMILVYPRIPFILVQNMRRAYAIRPYRIVAKYGLGGHFHAMILVQPLIPYPDLGPSGGWAASRLRSITVEPLIPFILVQKPSLNLLHLKIKILVLEGFIL